jgi:inorganic pyrophosphatase
LPLANDNIWSDARDVSDLPSAITERDEIFFFSTYNMTPDRKSVITIERICGVEHALKVVAA